MTRPSRHNEDFNIIEITEREDFRSPAGRLIATQSLRGPHDTLFLSTPCTGGSKWTTINRHKGGEETNSKIDKHDELFWELWESFVIVLKHAERVRALFFSSSCRDIVCIGRTGALPVFLNSMGPQCRF